MVYTESQVLLVHCVTLFASILSMFGSAFILVSFFLFGKGKGLTRLVIFLALGDFGWSVTVVMNNILLLKYGSVNDTLCYFFRGAFQFFAGSTVLWTLWIAFYLYVTVFRTKSITASEKEKEQKQDTVMMVIFHITAWGEPLAILVYCYSAKIFARSGDGIGLCYPNSTLIHFWSWFFPIILSFAVSVIVYTLLVAKLAKITSWKFIFKTFTRHTTTLSLPFRVSVYLLIFLVCWSLDLVQFVLSYTTPNSERDYIILVIYSILLQSQGAFDCIVYGLSNKELRNQHALFIETWGKLGPLLMTIFVLLCPLLVIPTFIARIYQFFTTPEIDETKNSLLTND